MTGGRVAQPGLPPELAFLREFGVQTATLHVACRDARRQCVAPVEALLAGGGVTDTLFYRSLAHLADVPFHAAPLALDPAADALRAVRDGRVRLADGTILLAPTGAAVRLLVEAARHPDLVPRGIAITTPATLEALVLRRAGAALARRASEALPNLEPALSARGALDARAVAVASGVVLAVLAFFVAAPTALAALGGMMFLAAICFRWRVCAAGLPPDRATPGHRGLSDEELPRYSVLVPLYEEAGMVPDLVRNLAALDYPAAKLEILLLVEADDQATLAALRATRKPPCMRVVVAPSGAPRTKPRALNIGLALVRGDIVTVYDAEDRPDRWQLRAATAQFADAPPQVACLQGRLAIVPGTGLLTRLFALEYAVLFDLLDVGLGRLGLPMPLGGTSNHFRTSALREIGEWDAWNVTEDADLGLRLARFGYRSDLLDSTTREEAPERLAVWFRQRRRWTKGWMQVALVLARDPSVGRELGSRKAAAVALMLVNLVIGPLATPPVLALAGWQLWRGGLPWLEGVAALIVPTVAILSTLWCGWAALRVRRLDALTAYVPLLLPYQLLIAIAAWGGLWDLVRRPYHWRKTPHGAEALSRSSRAAPPQRRRAHRPAMPG